MKSPRSIPTKEEYFSSHRNRNVVSIAVLLKVFSVGRKSLLKCVVTEMQRIRPLLSSSVFCSLKEAKLTRNWLVTVAGSNICSFKRAPRIPFALSAFAQFGYRSAHSKLLSSEIRSDFAGGN